jgi:hypothetical protein
VTASRSIAAAAAALLLALASPARGAPAASHLVVKLAARQGRVLASVDLARAFAPPVERELGNGLTNVVAVYVSVRPAEGGGPTLVHGRVIEILFDVWEEAYAVTVKDPRAPQGVHLVLEDFDALQAFLSNEKDLDLGPISLLPGEPFVVEARVEVNPVSKEQLLRTREFIANPSAGSRAGTGSRSVLGAMASFLLREPDPGSDVHLFRSRPLGPEEVSRR